MKKFKLSNWLYIIGSLLVFGSWVNLVPTWLAWIGWLMAISGWAVGTGERQSPVSSSLPPPRSNADEIAKLSLLQKEGVISEEEFHQEKERLLRQQ